MLAGLWGAKLAHNRKKLRQLASNLLSSTPRHYWDFDQALLRRLLWPEAVKNSLQHDAYTCNYEKFNQYHSTEPFPTQRQRQLYVGWGLVKGSENQTGIKPCPKTCRGQQEWTFC